MIFVDTGPLVARYLSSDSRHRDAVRLWKDVARQRLVTTNHVLDETWTLLSRRAGGAFAAERARNVYRSAALDIAYVNRDDEIQAVDRLAKFADQAVSFTDCVSFVVMNRLGVRTSFTFDRHFNLAGFQAIGL